MKASYGKIFQTLLNNVAEVKFIRKRPVAGLPPIRRMLATNNMGVLGSANGKIVLNYRTPTNLPHYNPAAANVIITWDILMQDFRTINAADCDIVKTYAPNEEFWKYFNENIFPMSVQQKQAFMMT